MTLGLVDDHVVAASLEQGHVFFAEASFQPSGGFCAPNAKEGVLHVGGDVSVLAFSESFVESVFV